MKFKGFWYDSLMICLIAGISAIFIAITALLKYYDLAIAEGIAFLVVCIIVTFRAITAKKRYKKFVIKTAKKLDFTNQKVLSTFPFPVAVCDEEGYIRWCSDLFLRQISCGEITQTDKIGKYANGADIDSIKNSDETCVAVNGKYFSVYPVEYQSAGEMFCGLYFLDNTKLKKTEIEYHDSLPYAVMIEMDNLDDSRNDFRDSEKTEIRSQVEAALDNWSESYDSFIKKIGDDRYLVITEKKNISRMIKDKFSVLETVRAYEYKGKKTGVTLSIGVSHGDNIKSCEKKSRKALEMALGRGGDQVAIRTQDGYDYIGGVSKSAEKRNKVKSRIVGSSLAELMKSSGNIIIMGHSFTDLDAIGAAVGVACAAQSFDIPVFIATDRNKTLAGTLIEKLDNENMGNLIIDQEYALELTTQNTLLIVVDTHIEKFVEFPKLYEKARNRVIIDHHRRAVVDIDSAQIFHHDPGASSTCEMVTELIQYINPDIKISETVAEALLAGIMLDTKDFVVGTGVRTFEAAAFLKDKNADMVKVKKLFANTLEMNKLRTAVISSAESFMKCAIATADFESKDIRVISAQAADELLKVNNIKASFVVFENAGAINISARSFGEINVQVIMESLGGGGHQTMAACQLKDYDIKSAEEALKKVIEEFFENNPKQGE